MLRNLTFSELIGKVHRNRFWYLRVVGGVEETNCAHTSVASNMLGGVVLKTKLFHKTLTADCFQSGLPREF